MKNIAKSLILLLTVFSTSCSVEDVQDRPIIKGSEAAVLTAPAGGEAYVLSPDDAEKQIERFTWNSADYGGNVQVNYTLEIDTKGNEFKTAKVIGSVISENQISVTQEQLNGPLLALNAEPFEALDYEVRIKSDVAGANILYSNSKTITVTAYTTETPKLYIGGSFQSESGYGTNWDYSTAPYIEAEGYGKTAFEGYVYFDDVVNGAVTDQGFNFSSNASGTGTIYGLGNEPGTIAIDGDNLSSSAGYYLVKADTDPTKLTYSMALATFGVIGDALKATTGGDGWGSDVDMIYDKTTKLWSLTVQLDAGGFKFRANDAWDLNYGGSGVDGVLVAPGDNIAVTSPGSYTITLDLSSPRNYTYTLTKN